MHVWVNKSKWSGKFCGRTMHLFSEIIDWNQISFPPNPYRAAGALFDYFTTGLWVLIGITCIWAITLISTLATKRIFEQFRRIDKNERKWRKPKQIPRNDLKGGEGGSQPKVINWTSVHTHDEENLSFTRLDFSISVGIGWYWLVPLLVYNKEFPDWCIGKLLQSLQHLLFSSMPVQFQTGQQFVLQRSGGKEIYVKLLFYGWPT